MNWTCEGLKLGYNVFVIGRKNSVNWTCEGLKLVCYNSCEIAELVCELNLWGIETQFQNYNLQPVGTRVNWTCEGLKHYRNTYCFMISLLVWIEPVRDWNNLTALIPPRNAVGCELNLWGIETDEFLSHSFFTSLVWIEPVRDWNQLIPLSSFPKVKVWIEPVRDWNNGKVVREFVERSCVNWTCEGLKLDYFNGYFNIAVGCELNLWGIETKSPLPDLRNTRQVWIEPVRDWNTKYQIIVKTRLQVWIEPVRDWNLGIMYS